ncbi:MAG: sulfatase [Anaerolineaceae bacterium]|nr:MAG: sulfatase [Anaerolineaceae bacterium]
MNRPDILLIILDTVRRDRLSIYERGGHADTSPAFDRFADSATLYERAISPAQWTVPAHASLFTGLYPTAHQVTQATSRLNPTTPTLARILTAHGYHTAGFCNNPLVGVLDNGLIDGFEDFYNYAGAAPNRPQDLTRSRIRRAMADYWRRFAGTVSQQFARNDWLFRISLHPLLTPLWTRSINYKGNTARSIDDMIGFIGAHRAGRRRDERPLFAFLNLMGAHMPYRPPRPYLQRIAPQIASDKAAYRYMAAFNADAGRWASPAQSAPDDWQKAVVDGFYRAEIAHQDAHLGRLLDYLKRSGALDDTLVIIAADHGEGHGDHGFFGHSFVVYQELVHVPLVIHDPHGATGGRRHATNVSTRRLFHTILDAAGVADPAVNPTGDLSLRHLPDDPADDAEADSAFAEAIPPQMLLSVVRRRDPSALARLRLNDTRRGLYRGAHKLAMVGERVEGLFDVADDPAEAHDIAARLPDVAARLRDEITQFTASTHATPTDDGLSDDMLDHLRALGYVE